MIDRNTKLLIIISAVTLSLPPLMLTTQVPTEHYRDVFYYADLFIYQSIIDTGHIPTSAQMLPSTETYLSKYWGKIFTRIKSPAFPILITEYSLITGSSPSAFYVGFPGYLLPGLGFVLLSHYIFGKTRVTIFSGTVGALAPNVRPEYTMNLNSANIFLGSLCIYVLFKIFLSGPSGKKSIRNAIVFAVLSAALFYWYPSAFFDIGIVTVMLAIFAKKIGANQVTDFLLPITFSGILLLQVFNIPLPTYIHWFTSAAIRILEGEILTVSSTGGQSITTAIPPSYYSAVGIIAVLPLGVLGGYLAVRRFLTMAFVKNQLDYSIPTVAWGAAVLLVSLFYLSSGSSWLLTRPVFFSLPVVILGASIAVNRFDSKAFLSVFCVVCVLLSASFALSTTTALMEIQTYQAETVEGGEWIAQYGAGTVLGDTKQGSPIITNGYRDYYYPQTQQGLTSLYYSTSEGEIQSYINNRNAHMLIISDQMVDTGLYATDYNHVPITNKSASTRDLIFSSIYDNGETNALYTRG